MWVSWKASKTKWIGIPYKSHSKRGHMKRWARHDAKKSKELFHIEHSVQFCFPVFCQEVCPLDCGSFKRSLTTKETIPMIVTFLESWIGSQAKLYYTSSSLGLWDIFGIFIFIWDHHKRNNSINCHILGRDG